MTEDAPNTSSITYEAGHVPHLEGSLEGSLYTLIDASKVELTLEKNEEQTL